MYTRSNPYQEEGVVNQPHPLNPRLHNMDIYSYHEGQDIISNYNHPEKMPGF